MTILDLTLIILYTVLNYLAIERIMDKKSRIKYRFSVDNYLMFIISLAYLLDFLLIIAFLVNYGHYVIFEF